MGHPPPQPHQDLDWRGRGVLGRGAHPIDPPVWGEGDMSYRPLIQGEQTICYCIVINIFFRTNGEMGPPPPSPTPSGLELERGGSRGGGSSYRPLIWEEKTICSY